MKSTSEKQPVEKNHVMFRDMKGTNLHIRNPISLKLGKKEYSSALNSTTGEVALQSECRIKALQAWER